MRKTARRRKIQMNNRWTSRVIRKDQKKDTSASTQNNSMKHQNTIVILRRKCSRSIKGSKTIDVRVTNRRWVGRRPQTRGAATLSRANSRDPQSVAKEKKGALTSLLSRRCANATAEIRAWI